MKMSTRHFLPVHLCGFLPGNLIHVKKNGPINNDDDEFSMLRANNDDR